MFVSVGLSVRLVRRVDWMMLNAKTMMVFKYTFLFRSRGDRRYKETKCYSVGMTIVHYHAIINLDCLYILFICVDCMYVYII